MRSALGRCDDCRRVWCVDAFLGVARRLTERLTLRFGCDRRRGPGGWGSGKRLCGPAAGRGRGMDPGLRGRLVCCACRV